MLTVVVISMTHSHRCCFAHLRELLSELVQFLLQRGLLLLSGSHLVTDLTDLSGDASRHSNTSGFPSSDVGALHRARTRSQSESQEVWDTVAVSKMDRFSESLTFTRILTFCVVILVILWFSLSYKILRINICGLALFLCALAFIEDKLCFGSLAFWHKWVFFFYQCELNWRVILEEESKIIYVLMNQ